MAVGESLGLQNDLVPSFFGTAVPAGNGRKIEKSQRHPKDFPGGPPPQYYPGLALLNFRVQMGSGVFSAVWPLATGGSASTQRQEVGAASLLPELPGSAFAIQNQPHTFEQLTWLALGHDLEAGSRSAEQVTAL